MKLHRLLFIFTTLCLCGMDRESHGQNSTPAPPPVIMTFPAGTSIEDVKDTGNKAISNLLSHFAASQHAPGAKGFILLPLTKDIDNGYFNHQFETELTQRFADKQLKVYTRDDKTLAQIFDFNAWAQTFPEAIDERTVQKLGGIVDAPAIISPRLDISVDDRGTITARANMRAILRRTTELPPGISEGVARLKAAPTSAELLLWGGYALAGVIALIVLRKVTRAVSDARRPR